MNKARRRRNCGQYGDSRQNVGRHQRRRPLSPQVVPDHCCRRHRVDTRRPTMRRRRSRRATAADPVERLTDRVAITIGRTRAHPVPGADRRAVPGGQLSKRQPHPSSAPMRLKVSENRARTFSGNPRNIRLTSGTAQRLRVAAL